MSDFEKWFTSKYADLYWTGCKKFITEVAQNAYEAGVMDTLKAYEKEKKLCRIQKAL